MDPSYFRYGQVVGQSDFINQSQLITMLSSSQCDPDIKLYIMHSIAVQKENISDDIIKIMSTLFGLKCVTLSDEKISSLEQNPLFAAKLQEFMKKIFTFTTDV